MSNRALEDRLAKLIAAAGPMDTRIRRPQKFATGSIIPDSDKYACFDPLPLMADGSADKLAPSSISITISGVTMKAFETKFFIYGQDSSTMSNEQLIKAIERTTQEIDRLVKLNVASSHIDLEITMLTKACVKIVKLLDKRK